MVFRHYGLSRSPKHRLDLYKESSRKKKCHCIRGGLKLANCFGSWDNSALEVPPGNINSSHVCDGHFLMNDIKQSTHSKIMNSVVKQSNKMYESTISLNYLSRVNKSGCCPRDAGGGHLSFRHFESVEEYIKHYRDNKPNSLNASASQETAGSMDQCEKDTAEEEINYPCIYCAAPTAKSLDNSTKEPPTCSSNPQSEEAKCTSCKCSQQAYRQPNSFPLRATGKAIIPNCASLIMRLPALEVSSNSYWIPVNAVIQKRIATSAMYHSFGYYDQRSDASNCQTEFPSLRNKVTTPADGFPPSKKKVTMKRATQSHYGRTGRTYNKVSKIAEDLMHADDQPCSEDLHHGASVATANRSYLGSGRLLSGQLKSSSTLPTCPESLQDLVRIQKSPCSRPVSKLTTSSHAKTLQEERQLENSSNSTSGSDFSDGPTGETEMATSKALATNVNLTKATHVKAADFAIAQTSNEKLTLNKLNITRENSKPEELLLAEPMIISCSPLLELKPAAAANELDPHALQEFCQEHYKPKNVAITFTKPQKLFHLKSAQSKLLWNNSCSTTKQKDPTKSKPQSTTWRGGYHSVATNRSAINRNNGDNTAQGVFGIQNHPRKKCALRAQERRKLKLETKNYKHLERKDAPAGGGKKVQVYLIKTRKSLENILPKLNSESYYYIYEQRKGSIDLFGE